MAQISVATFGAVGDGTTDDTTHIQNAINSATAQSIVNFPGTSAFYKITAPLTGLSNLILRGEGKGTIIDQQTWGKPAFDLIGCNDISVEQMMIRTTQARTTITGSPFRGSDINVYNAGVWANGSRVATRHLYCSGFRSGVYYSNWNGSQLLGQQSDNLVDDIVVDTVDFGFLTLGQLRPVVTRLRGTYQGTIGSADPTHLIYWSDAQGITQSNDVVVSDCAAYNGTGPGTGSYPYQFKGVVGGSFNNLVGENCGGMYSIQFCQNLAISNSVSLNDVGNPNGSIYIPGLGEQNITFTNTLMQMSGAARAIRIDGTDIVFRGLNLYAYRPTSLDQDTDITVHGLRNSIVDLSYVNSQAATGGSICLGVYSGTDHFFRNLRITGARVAVYLNGVGNVTLDINSNLITLAGGSAGGFPQKTKIADTASSHIIDSHIPGGFSG